ncbi:unnamed protein product [Musa acuminata subsp. malaccensis]|uniref:(wild Malaysian banana) hypothetical protein n=1 Tax=Musa acuminata subsp. malaccensis TaxID=214687 RepID=A0A804HPT4_MUSAM|nr:PREDICTED: uncharacterized protein LOC103979060 [Musa acuminata subsp. malaccensis]CAG1858422.1 unnamed protein product [Musa acuminata subsp. malaccensis]
MLFFIRRYLRRPPKATGGDKESHKEEQGGKDQIGRQSPRTMDGSEGSTRGCCPVSLFNLVEPSNTKHHTRTTTTRISRSNFAKLTKDFVFPNTRFTNHESLPDLPDALSSFITIYPQYGETQEADRIRNNEYYHLADHVCLDYCGFSLFSHAQMHSSIPSSSTDHLPWGLLQPPFFSITYKSASLKSQVQYGNQDTLLEAAIRKRIMQFLNILDGEYSMVCTANRTTAFRLLAESYPFHANKGLLSVYDYESEAVNAIIESAQRRGAKVMSASFSWPSLRIHSGKLMEKLSKRKKKSRGLFVFPLQSRISGARYPYLWMTVAKEHGWHVVLDACALGPKDLDTLGLSLIQPDFIICSFFKVFGENPSGFAGLFIKKSSIAALESSTIARSIGIVSIIPARRLSQLTDDYSGTGLDVHSSRNQFDEDDTETTNSFSGPISTHICNDSAGMDNMLGETASTQKQKQVKRSEQGESSKENDENKEISSDIVLSKCGHSIQEEKSMTITEADKSMEIVCRGLDHADSLGLLHINSRLRCIVNWLVIALMKLQHPHSESGHYLVRIYGPRIKFDRGPALAFNVFDWRGEKIEPEMVQKLADRSNISLSRGFLNNIWFPDKYEAEKDKVLERRACEVTAASNKRKGRSDMGIDVLNASFSFLTNFEDAYRLWTFIAKFLDADFVEKERRRYFTLNQKMIEV